MICPHNSFVYRIIKDFFVERKVWLCDYSSCKKQHIRGNRKYLCYTNKRWLCNSRDYSFIEVCFLRKIYIRRLNEKNDWIIKYVQSPIMNKLETPVYCVGYAYFHWIIDENVQYVLTFSFKLCAQKLLNFFFTFIVLSFNSVQWTRAVIHLYLQKLNFRSIYFYTILRILFLEIFSKIF